MNHEDRKQIARLILDLEEAKRLDFVTDQPLTYSEKAVADAVAALRRMIE